MGSLWGRTKIGRLNVHWPGKIAAWVCCNGSEWKGRHAGRATWVGKRNSYSVNERRGKRGPRLWKCKKKKAPRILPGGGLVIPGGLSSEWGTNLGIYKYIDCCSTLSGIPSSTDCNRGRVRCLWDSKKATGLDLRYKWVIEDRLNGQANSEELRRGGSGGYRIRGWRIRIDSSRRPGSLEGASSASR